MKKLPKFTTAFLLSFTFFGLCFVFKDDDGMIAQTFRARQQSKEPSQPVRPLKENKPLADSDIQQANHLQTDPPNTKEREQNSEQAQKLLREIQHRLASYASVSAEIHETIRNGNQRFQAKGRYLQGIQMQLRMELVVQAGESTGHLTQVCDGQLLWTETKFSPIPEREVDDMSRYHRVTRRNVQKILLEAMKVGDKGQAFVAAELGFGGLPALMAAFERAFEFQLLKKEKVGNDDCFVIEGRWNGSLQEKWKFLQKKRKTVTEKSIPDTVRIYVHPRLLVPRRIEYRKSGEDRKAPETLLAINYENIAINVPIDGNAFRYTPPDDVFSTDTTHKYIKKLEALR